MFRSYYRSLLLLLALILALCGGTPRLKAGEWIAKQFPVRLVVPTNWSAEAVQNVGQRTPIGYWTDPEKERHFILVISSAKGSSTEAPEVATDLSTWMAQFNLSQRGVLSDPETVEFNGLKYVEMVYRQGQQNGPASTVARAFVDAGVNYTALLISNRDILTDNDFKVFFDSLQILTPEQVAQRMPTLHPLARHFEKAAYVSAGAAAVLVVLGIASAIWKPRRRASHAG
jgi:hypothetical protein